MSDSSSDDWFGAPTPNLYLTALFIAALVSGRYKQTHGDLRKTDENTEDDDCRYCVTGVGCEVVRMVFPEKYSWEDSGLSTFIIHPEEEGSPKMVTNAPPTPVREFLGLGERIDPEKFAQYLGTFDVKDEMVRYVKEMLDHSAQETTTLSNVIIYANDEGASLEALGRALASYYRLDMGMPLPNTLTHDAKTATENVELTEIVEMYGITPQMGSKIDISELRTFDAQPVPTYD